MTDLGAERNIQLDTGDVEGKIELVLLLLNDGLALESPPANYY
jgi:hypothetical protein